MSPVDCIDILNLYLVILKPVKSEMKPIKSEMKPVKSEFDCLLNPSTGKTNQPKPTI